MRAISTKLETLSSTTSTVVSFGMFCLRMGWESVTEGSVIGLPRQESLDLLGQDINVNRLLDVAVAPGFQRLFAVAAHYVRSDRHDRNGSKPRGRLDAGGQGVTVR